MVNDRQVAGDQLVLQAGAVRNGDLVALVGDDDAGTGEADALAK